jgi:predicted PurR-regulated permease PerM
VARIASFIVLVVFLLLIGAIFIQVMADFILPLFLALLLVVIFGPMHRYIKVRCGNRNQVAAGISTLIILLVVLLPTALIIVQAATQAIRIVSQAQEASQRQVDAGERDDQITFDTKRIGELVAEAAASAGIEVSPAEVKQTLIEYLQKTVAPVALSTPQWLVRLVLGFVIMAIALYYFLADGPEILRTMMRLSPLDDKYEQELVAQFDQLTRTIVVATLAAALTQGVLAGIGYYVAGVGSVILLTVITGLMAMVPFLGATSVWLPVCLYLYFYVGDTRAAIGLAIYSLLIVSTVDNFIKPLILHGGAKLHPLLALMSVLGGVTALGPIGIFVGPMAVAFLQTLLVMFNAELATIGDSLRTDGAASPAAKKKR